MLEDGGTDRSGSMTPEVDPAMAEKPTAGKVAWGIAMMLALTLWGLSSLFWFTWIYLDATNAWGPNEGDMTDAHVAMGGIWFGLTIVLAFVASQVARQRDPR